MGIERFNELVNEAKGHESRDRHHVAAVGGDPNMLSPAGASYREEVRDVASGVKAHGNVVTIARANKTAADFEADVKKLRESLPASGAQQAAAGNRLRQHLQGAATERDSLTRILDEPAAKQSGGSPRNRLREYLESGATSGDSLSRILG
jgi:hypothetical protein